MSVVLRLGIEKPPAWAEGERLTPGVVCAYSIMMMKLNVVIESRVWRTIPPTSTERTSPCLFLSYPCEILRHGRSSRFRL